MDKEKEMKSFRQYLNEVATEVPKNPNFKHKIYPNWNADEKDDNLSSHQYRYHDHDQNVHFNYAKKNPRKGRGIRDKHHSYISFEVGGDDLTRTGKENVKSASQKLSNVSHAIAHHIENTVKPNAKKHGQHFFSFHTSKEPDDSGSNPNAREQIYHKMTKRLMKRHGYELHKIHKDRDGQDGELTGEVRHIYKKKVKKK